MWTESGQFWGILLLNAGRGNMKLFTESYVEQASRWPKDGRHILAQHTDEHIVVYQAYSPEIGHFASEHGYFGPGFSLERMSWIKTGFLWTMYRSGWGTKENQQIILAIQLKRSAFSEMLKQAVHSSFVPEVYATELEWKNALHQSEVRLQWDPDHHPSGAKLERRAIQLGLRGSVLAKYAREWIIGIEDISGFVQAQRNHVLEHRYDLLLTPQEWVYWLDDKSLKQHLGLSKTEYDFMTPIEDLGVGERCTKSLKRSGIQMIEELVEYFALLFDENGNLTHSPSGRWLSCYEEIMNQLKLKGYPYRE